MEDEDRHEVDEVVPVACVVERRSLSSLIVMKVSFENLASKLLIERTIFAGVFIVKGKEDALATKNMVVGESVYGEKRVSVEDATGTSIEYRVWNPFRSKLAAAMMAGLENVHVKPGTKLLYLGAASGTTVSHCSDIVGPVSIIVPNVFSC